MRFTIALTLMVVLWGMIFVEGYVHTRSAERRFSAAQRNAIGAAASLVLTLLGLWIVRDSTLGRRTVFDPRLMASVVVPFLFVLWYTVPARGIGIRGVQREARERKAFLQFAVVLALLVSLFYMVGPILFPGL